METVFQIGRLAAVMALVCAAAALATPKGRLPLALRGVLKILRRDGGLAVPAPGEVERPSTARRLLALALVLAAFALCVF